MWAGIPNSDDFAVHLPVLRHVFCAARVTSRISSREMPLSARDAFQDLQGPSYICTKLTDPHVRGSAGRETKTSHHVWPIREIVKGYQCSCPKRTRHQGSRMSEATKPDDAGAGYDIGCRSAPKGWTRVHLTGVRRRDRTSSVFYPVVLIGSCWAGAPDRGVLEVGFAPTLISSPLDSVGSLTRPIEQISGPWPSSMWTPRTAQHRAISIVPQGRGTHAGLRATL